MSVGFSDCVLSEQFSGFSHIPRVVQPLPLILEHSTLQKRNRESINTSPRPPSPSLCPRQPLVCLLSVDWPLLDIPCQWSHTTCGLVSGWTWVYNCFFETLLSVLLDIYSAVESPYEISILDFSRNLHTVSTAVAPFYIPTCSAQGFSLLHILSNACSLLFPVSLVPVLVGCEVVSHCRFDLLFPNNSVTFLSGSLKIFFFF